MKKIFFAVLMLLPLAVVSQLPPQSSWFAWCSDTNTGAGFKVGGWAIPSTNDGFSSALLHSYPVPFSSPPAFSDFLSWDPYHWVDVTPQPSVIDTGKLWIESPDLSNPDWIVIRYHAATPGQPIYLQHALDNPFGFYDIDVIDAAATDGEFYVSNAGGKKPRFTDAHPIVFYRVWQPEPVVTVPLIAVAFAGILTGWHTWNTFRQ